MKKILILSLSMVFGYLNAQDTKYSQIMGETIAELNQIQSAEGYDPVINKFTRIAEAENDKWEPYYYQSLAQAFKGTKTNDTASKDILLDQALLTLSKAEGISDGNAEIVALQGFITMIKISVDPATRGQKLSGKAIGLFGQALSIDPENPRATLFLAQMKIGMAQFFGSSIEEPCGLIQKSLDQFEKYQPSSSFAPMWGQHMIGNYIKLCNEGPGQ